MNKYSIVFAGLFLFAGANTVMGSDPSKQETALQDIYICTKIVDDKQRLSCFDKSVQQTKNAEIAGNIVTMDRGDIEVLKQDAFGFNMPNFRKLRLPSLPKLTRNSTSKSSGLVTATQKGDEILSQNNNGAVTKVRYVVNRYRVKANGKYKFYLTNGQVWEQIGDKEFRISKLAKQLNAEIRQAAMGSYLMRINGKGSSIRVRRVS